MESPVKQQKVLLDSQKQFIYEINSLLRDNYSVRVSYFGEDLWFAKLHHLHNGRTLVLSANQNFMTLREGSRVLKCIPENAIPF